MMMVRKVGFLAVWLPVCAALFSDQAGEMDWRLENIGVVTHAIYQQRRCYALTHTGGAGPSRQALVAALNTRTGTVEWRRALPPGEGGDGVIVAGNGVVSSSGGGSRVRAWRVGDGALLWEAAAPAGGGPGGGALIAVAGPGGACAVVAVGGDAVLALDCEDGAPLPGWPWFAEAEDDASRSPSPDVQRSRRKNTTNTLL